MAGTDDRLQAYWQSFKAAVMFAFSSPARAAAVLLFSVLAYGLMILGSFPSYSLQILGDSIFNLGTAVSVLTWNARTSLGMVGFSLILLYSLMTGIALLNIIVLIRGQGLASLLNAGSITPAFLVGGCASCGAGVLGFLGFVGAVGALPFQGNELRVLGIILLVYFLTSTGNPLTCRIEGRK